MSHPYTLFHTTSKIVALAKSGMVSAARKLFDEMLQRDIVAWNAMLSSYSQMGLAQEALSLFSNMRIEGLKPDPFSFTAALSSITDVGGVNNGKRFHALIISFGYQSSLPVCNSMIDMYGKCVCPCSAYSVFKEMGNRNVVSWCSLLSAYLKSREFDSAHQLFDEMPHKNETAYNILFAGYSRFGKIELSMDLFKRMRMAGFEWDSSTFTSIMNLCTGLHEPCYGCLIHGFIIKTGWFSAVEASNSILSFYAKLSCHNDAMKIFESIRNPTQVSWNAMIDAHMKIGNVNEALAMFLRAPANNIISWTALIGGYARNGHGDRALRTFVDMLKSLIQPDDFTFGAALHACSNLAVLGQGSMVHGCIIHHGFASYVYVGNGLVNMYAKCGDIEGSSKVFCNILNKDLVSWNAMIFGFGLHGRAKEAIRVHEDMVENRVRPDKVTFIGLLMACGHSGLIEHGRVLFKSMESIYGIAHEPDHVACMVDMLGRGGYLIEASELTRDSKACEALLAACVMHKDVQLGREVGESLMVMEPLRESGYVLLSNLYCDSGHWRDAEKVRRAMVEQGVKKVPGCSWIEVRNMVMFFVAGISRLPVSDMKGLCQMLELLESEMRNPSFVGFNSEFL